MLNRYDADGFIRLWQIIGCKKRGISALLPISRSSWWVGVKTGKYPKPVKLSVRCAAWRVSDIRKLLEDLNEKMCTAEHTVARPLAPAALRHLPRLMHTQSQESGHE